MANTPPVNRLAIWNVRRSTAGSIPAGRGVALTGAFGADGAALIAPPAGADAKISGVTFETDPDDTNVGLMLQAGLSNVQVRLGTGAVSFGDPLHIQDATGVWETAPAGSLNVYYTALQSKAAGQLCWASPAAVSTVAIFRSSTPIVGTGLAQSVAHGLGYVPSVVRVTLCELPLPLGLTGILAVTQGAHDAVNLKFTAALGLKFHCEAW